MLNPNIYQEAQALDDWRASGQTPRPLEGIPFKVKDSYKVKGLTVPSLRQPRGLFRLSNCRDDAFSWCNRCRKDEHAAYG